MSGVNVKYVLLGKVSYPIVDGNQDENRTLFAGHFFQGTEFPFTPAHINKIMCRKQVHSKNLSAKIALKVLCGELHFEVLFEH
jgi:hypothetical protein